MNRISCRLFLYLLAAFCNHVDAQPTDARLTVTPLFTGVEASFRGLAVRGENEAWVTGAQGTVIRTGDAGQTWKQISIADSEQLDFRDVEVLPDGTILLMSVGNGDASRVIRSTNDGKTWHSVLVNPEPAGFFDGIAFDEKGKNGVLFGDPIDGRMEIYGTRDGGRTWTRAPEKQRPVMKKAEYAFAASGTSIKILERNIWIATGGAAARVHHSADGGATWRSNTTPIRSGNQSSGIFSMESLNAQQLFVIGGDYLHPEKDLANFASSVDGGRTWRFANSVRMPHKACIRSLGGGRLVTCGRTGVAYSNDFGQSWHSVTTDGYYVLAVHRESATGFLAGSDGRVARFALLSRKSN